MSRQSFSRGDRVRVTIEGEITRILDIEPGSEEVELRVEHNGSASFVYTDMATVEKIEPPVETFGPGDTIREKDTEDAHCVRTLGFGGWLNHGTKMWYPSELIEAGNFTSDDYERVSLG